MGTAFKTQTRNMHSLPKLAYAYNALEPSISAQIMEIHHSKHHNTYVTNLNKAESDLAAAVQGTGWTWLGYNSASKRLEVSSTANQDPLLSSTPLVGIDMWEHAYYLQYQNGKAAYLDNIWAVMNWGEAEKRMGGAGKL